MSTLADRYETLLYEERDGTPFVTLNRPACLPAPSPPNERHIVSTVRDEPKKDQLQLPERIQLNTPDARPASEADGV
jgi:hypothetical protein